MSSWRGSSGEGEHDCPFPAVVTSISITTTSIACRTLRASSGKASVLTNELVMLSTIEKAEEYGRSVMVIVKTAAESGSRSS